MTELLIKHRGNVQRIRVLQYNTASELPKRSQDHTIALIASTPIKKVFYQSSEPQECDLYDVWIAMNSLYNTLNFISSNAEISLGLFEAYIKTSDGWFPIETWIYQNEQWQKIWSGRLYHEGSEYEVYTGGWTTHDRTAREGATAQPKHPIIVRNEDNIEAITLNTSEASGGGMFCTAERIDLTPYSTLVFEGTFSSPYGESYSTNFVAGAWSVIPDYYLNNRLAYYELNAKTTTKITVDVTNVNTSAYIGFGIAYSQATLTRCYLIPKEEL